MQVELFIPCTIDQFFPQVGWDMVHLLEKLGCKVSYNPNQTCCAMPAYHNGHRESAKEVATKFLEDFAGTSAIVAPSTACVHMVAEKYDGFFRNTSNHNIYRALQKRIVDLSDFLMYRLKVQELPTKFPHRIVYHQNCQSIHRQNDGLASYELLKLIPGLEVIPIDQKVSCCGYNADYATHNEDDAVKRATLLLDAFEASGTQYVVSNDYQCLLHFKSLVTKKKPRPYEFMHLAELLAKGIDAK